MPGKYTISEETAEKIRRDREIMRKATPLAARDEECVRRNMNFDRPNVLRPAFARDVDKVLNSKYYNRLSDKTQVYSFYHNDDITRRALHVQLVSRVARNIGYALGLNLDLIEAIALGHDIGHTPFGHAGESFLNRLYHEHTGRYFNHNVHSVRVLDGLLELNLSLQTLDGILCHNGEMSLSMFAPAELKSFDEFDRKVERCYVDKEAIGHLVPNTLEACVVRISDMIAYIGKDRQDAYKAGFGDNVRMIAEGALGSNNTYIINTLINNIVDNSYGKPYIKLDREYHKELERYKEENYAKIYLIPELKSKYDEVVSEMFDQMYRKLLNDVKRKDTGSIIYRHHIQDIVNYKRNYVKSSVDYTSEEPNQIVVDYIASMTDDYFLALYAYLFPESKLRIEFKSYFDD